MVWDGSSNAAHDAAGGAEMVGRGEFMDVHEAWVKGKSISEIARLTGRDRKTIRRLLREGGPKPRA
jgi:hypothetical protein